MAKQKNNRTKTVKPETMGKEQKERIDNFMVFSTIAVFFLAVVLMVLCNLGHNYRYVLSVQGFEKTIMWIGIVGVAVFALYSWIKKKNRYGISALCAAFSVMMFAVYHIDGSALKISGYGFAYLMMGLYLILVYLFCWLAESGRYQKANVRRKFLITAVAATTLLMALLITAYALQMHQVNRYREGYTGPALSPVAQEEPTQRSEKESSSEESMASEESVSLEETDSTEAVSTEEMPIEEAAQDGEAE